MNVGKTSIVFAFLLVAAAFSLVITVFPTAKAVTLYVGTGPGNYTTIQDAINNANPWDTVYVYEGTYKENIIVNKTVSLVGDNKESTIIDGNGTSDTINITVNSVSITGFTIKNSKQVWGDAGIDMRNVDGCYIADNIISDNFHGIFLFIANSNTIANNKILSNSADGISLRYSHNNIITFNEVQENGDGIQIAYSDNNTMANNTLLMNAETGISLGYSDINHVSNNNLLYNGDGIYLDSSGMNIIDNNYLFNHNDGIQLFNSSANIISENIVVNSRYGYYLEYSNNNQVSKNTAFYSEDGIRILNSNDNTITENKAMDNNDDGIQLSFSEFSMVANNILSLNFDDGIFLESSDYNTITDNYAFGNGDEGIELLYSKGNLIINNTLKLNTEFGVHLSTSTHNWVYHNNFVYNSQQAYDDTGANYWNDSYLSGGNYWTDYLGDDLKSGANQDLHGSDGIGDTPYDITSGTSQDQYPLMGPYWPPFVTDLNQPPTCAISAPTAGTTISGIYIVKGTAYDPDGMIERVEIRIDDGEWIRVVGATSWNYNLDTTSLADGEHMVYVRSYDGANYSGEVSVSMNVDNSAPQPSILEQPWFWIAIIVIIILLFLVLIVFILKGRKEPFMEEKISKESKSEVKESSDEQQKSSEVDIEKSKPVS